GSRTPGVMPSSRARGRASWPGALMLIRSVGIAQMEESRARTFIVITSLAAYDKIWKLYNTPRPANRRGIHRSRTAAEDCHTAPTLLTNENSSIYCAYDL